MNAREFDVVPARLTILIISWNAWHYMGPCLDSLFASDWRDFEVLVIDNASSDRSAEKIARAYPQVRLIRNAENIGHTLAVNQGFRAARSELILVLDSDTESAPDALRRLVEFMDAHPDVDLVAPRTFNTDGTVQESARNFPDAFSGLFGRQSWLSLVFPNNPFTRRYLAREHLDAKEPFRVESVASSCMMLRRNLLERMGPWDEGYPGYFVETDWCYRLKRGGIKVYCVPASRVVHHENNNRKRRRDPRRIWMFHRGAMRFYRRNRTLGWADPRNLVAIAALSARGALLIVLNMFKQPAPPAPPARPGAAEAPSPQARTPASALSEVEDRP